MGSQFEAFDAEAIRMTLDEASSTEMANEVRPIPAMPPT
jgi:hypothetical protein